MNRSSVIFFFLMVLTTVYVVCFFVFVRTSRVPIFTDRSQFTATQNESAGPSELYAEPAFTKRLPVSQLIVKGHQEIVPILMYHHIGIAPDPTDKIRDDLSVSPDLFEQEVSWLASRGYHSVTLRDVYLSTQEKMKLPSNPIVFTFDDGYDDVFTNAVPILKKYGFVGSFAIITQWPATTSGSNTYASWEQIRSAMNQGMEIVSHTQNHFDGTNPTVTRDFILKELKGSRADLKEHLGIDVNLLIYPYGHYNADYISAAEEAGFVMGVTVHEGSMIDPEHIMEVPRIRVHGHETLKTFKNILWGATHS